MFIHQGKLNCHKIFRDQRGFTLIEAMASLVILTVAITPALFLSNSAVNAGFTIRDDMVAAGLAQEGIEVVRSIRDANWFNARAFDTGLAAGVYRVEWNSTSLIALGANPPLELQSGIYSYSGGVNTVFYRTITITKLNGAELKVIVQVSWLARGTNTKKIQVEEHLYDWR